MSPKYSIFTLLVLFLFCLSTLVYPSGTSANGGALKLKLDPPAKWKTGRPEKNTVLPFTANVLGDTTQITSTRYVFTLRDVSDYTGFCMNAGTQPGDKKDIYFRQSDQPENTATSNLTYTVSGSNGEKLTVTCNQVTTSIPFYVYVDDYGAHGILDGTVYLNDKKNSDDEEADNTPSNNTDADYCLSIPLDDNGNDIADGWKNDATVVTEGRSGYDPWKDDEAGPDGNAKHGDGFTVFEEYRGFWIKGKHQDTDPQTKKDLFIFSEFTNEGYGYASNLPDVFKLRLIDKNNMASNTRRMNRYTCGDGKSYRPHPGVSRNPQSAVHVVNASSDENRNIRTSHPGLFGVVTHTVTVPYNLNYCRVYPHRIKEKLEWTDEHPDLDNYYRDYYKKKLKGTIGHEIGHCIEVYDVHMDRHLELFGVQHGRTIMQADVYANAHPDGTEFTEDENRAEFAEVVRTLAQANYPYPAEHKAEYNLVASADRGNNFAADPKRKSKQPSEDEGDDNSDADATLAPSDELYTSTSGSSHTANFAASSPYTSVKWYVKSPSDTSDRGELVETDPGDGSATTASLDYTFAADAAAGTYVITASVTTSSGTYEVSYTITLSTVPDAPTIWRVELSSDTSVLVSWNPPAADGGSAITLYECRHQVSGATESGEWKDAGTALSKVISDVTSGTNYTVEVRAKNSVGYSVASSAFAFSVPSVTTGFAPASGSSYTATAEDTHVGEVQNTTLYGAWLYVNGKKIKWKWGSRTSTRLSLDYTFPEDASGTYTMGCVCLCAQWQWL